MEPESSLPYSQAPDTCPYQYEYILMIILIVVSFTYMQRKVRNTFNAVNL